MKSNGDYEWKFSTLGGVTRVNINTGEDIAHLAELDQKLWTVLSCPASGLEMDADCRLGQTETEEFGYSCLPSDGTPSFCNQ